MDIDTKKLLSLLKDSTEENITVEKDFFIKIVELLEQANETIKVEEVFNYNNTVIIENDKTIINGGVLLDGLNSYSNMTGEVLIDVKELKALMQENKRQRLSNQNMKLLIKNLEVKFGMVNDKLIEERRLKDLNKVFSNSLNQNIKVSILG